MANVAEPLPNGKTGNGKTNGQYSSGSKGTRAPDPPPSKNGDGKQPTRPLSDELREVLDHYFPR